MTESIVSEPDEGSASRMSYFPSDIDNDTRTNSPITYQNAGEPGPSGTAPPRVELEYPSEFYIESVPKESPIGPVWNPVTKGVGNAPIMLVGQNPRRSRMLIFIDGASAGPVWLSANAGGAVGAGAPAIALAVGSSIMELRHTGRLYGICPAGSALVYIIEENYR